MASSLFPLVVPAGNGEGDQIRTTPGVTYNIAAIMHDEYPEVDKVAITTSKVSMVFHEGKIPLRQDGYYAETAFFDIFSWEILSGDPAKSPGRSIINGSRISVAALLLVSTACLGSWLRA